MTNVLDSEEVCAMLQRIEQRLERIESRLDRSSIRPRQAHVRALIIALLPIAYAAYGEDEFLVSELVDAAKQPGQEALRQALAAIGNTRQIGKLLAANADAMTTTHRLEFVRRSSDGRVWRIVTTL